MTQTLSKPTQSDHLDRLDALRGLEPAAARPAAWRWLKDFNATKDRQALAEVFIAGRRPEGPRGACEGAVLGLFGTPFLGFVDVLARAGQMLGGIGWTGKTFKPDGTGFNRLTASARPAMFLAMPRYGFEREDGELIGFRFDHRLESSPADPELDVRSVIYDNPMHANPLMLPRTRDELVEIVDGVYLGRALLQEAEGWAVVAYFALREPEATPDAG